MSSALAIAGVTAVLKDLLDGGMIDHNLAGTMGQGVMVSALAPDCDRARQRRRAARLNLFLHQATPNAALAQCRLPLARPGRRAHRQSAARARPALSADRLRHASTSRPRSCSAMRCRCCTRTPVLAARGDPHRAQSAEPAGDRQPAAEHLSGAAGVRSRRPDRADQDHAVGDEHRGTVEAVDRVPVALPADRALPGHGGADRIAQGGALAAAGAEAASSRRAPAWCRRSRRSNRSNC